jgi:hypothetical protein
MDSFSSFFSFYGNFNFFNAQNDGKERLFIQLLNPKRATTPLSSPFGACQSASFLYIRTQD